VVSLVPPGGDTGAAQHERRAPPVTAVRPGPVVIDDLASPRLPPEAEPIRAAMAEMGAAVSLEPDALLTAASAETGLDDFGDERFRDHLDVVCRSLREEAGLGCAGVAAAFVQLTQLLKNRLLVEDLVRRHPEIERIEVARPIVICGLPRTGTTHLHNLIAADPAIRSLPYWESEQPVVADGQPDERRANTAAALDVVNTALPHFKRMHEMTPEHVHEEINLLALDFSSMYFETMAPMPGWRDYYRATDQRPAYRYLKRVLQALQWLRGGERWVLKSPQHLEQFPALVDTFPNATYVVTHRDPVSVTASLTTMMTYLARLNLEPVDPVAIGRYWADRLETMLRACVETRDVLPAERSIDVRFQEFMADDVAMVERIYAIAAQPMGGDVRAAMDSFMADHPRGRHGGIVYDLTQFGLDRAERRASLQFYVDRFGVEIEEG
jgi:hypothetical protein